MRGNAKIAPTSRLAAKNQGKCKVGPLHYASTRLRQGTTKSDGNHGEKRPKILEKPLRKDSASKLHERKLFFSLPDATWHRFWTPWLAPRHSRTMILESQGAPGGPPNAPGPRRGRPETLPRRSRVAPRMLLVLPGVLRESRDRL